MQAIQDTDVYLRACGLKGKPVNLTPSFRQSERSLDHIMEFPKIIQDDPELKKKVEAYLAALPKEQKEKDWEGFKKFVTGEITWAELTSIPKSVLKAIAEIAYYKMTKGDYAVSEVLFKGLSVIDHANWYYRAALGAIYQKQKQHAEALEEYSNAIVLSDTEVSTFVNRAECHLALGDKPSAIADLKQALVLDPQVTSRWGKRAKSVLVAIEGKK